MPYQSELAQFASVARTDADGNLLNPDGSIHTKRREFKPLPKFTKEQRTDGSDVAVLLQWQYDSYPDFDGTIYIDGVQFGPQGNESRALRLTTANGILEPTGAVPVVVPPVTIPQVVDAGNQVVELKAPKAGQVRPRTQGFGRGTLTFRLQIEASVNTETVGFFRIAEVPGAITADRIVRLINNGKEISAATNYGSSPFFGYVVGATGNIAGLVNLEPGTLDVEVKNVMPDGYSTADVLFDWRTPNNH